MGKGKTASDSASVYIDEKNKQIHNDKLISDRMNFSEENIRKHSKRYFAHFFRDSDKTLRVTRNPLTIDDSKARTTFLDLICNFEENNMLKLSDISKDELFYLFLDFAEESNSLIHLKDDARQFMAYRFLFPDIMKLYFYKLFYPRIFEFTVTEESELIFRSEYIEKNFKYIYRQIEFLCLTIVYDAILIATETCACNHIEAMKKFALEITPEDNVENLISNIDEVLKNSKDKKAELVNKLKPSIVFFAKHYHHLYHGKKSNQKNVNFILKRNAFLAGKRADDSRNALIKAYAECSPVLTDTQLPFTSLFNMYYINKRTHLYDLNIMHENIDFISYAIDGIVTKHHISQMISENGYSLSNQLSDSLRLYSVYNNPNCIISNFRPKDYEMLDFIINRTAKTFEKYYLSYDNKDVPISSVSELIDFIDQRNFTTTLLDTIIPFDALETNNVDFEKILDWETPFNDD